MQSMDPARVEGLARVLADAERTRQVIVFTHDDRLPEAARRLGIQATVHSVTRRAKSLVEVRQSSDPASSLLGDARTVALTDNLPKTSPAGSSRASASEVALEVVQATEREWR